MVFWGSNYICSYEYSETGNMRRHKIVLFLLGGIFFCVYSFLAFTVAPYQNSPDEAANFFFTRRAAEGVNIAYPEQLNQWGKGRIHPRSTVVRGLTIVPVSFFGITMLYGRLAQIIGVWSISFLTPFFAVCAVFAFYFLIRKIWNPRVAFISSLLLFISPPYWYFATRGMFHAVLFVDLLIFSAFFFWVKPWRLFLKKIQHTATFSFRYLDDFFGAISLGFAIWTRTIEIWWIGILGIVLGIFFRKKIDRKNLFVWMGMIGFFVLRMVYGNYELYGSYLQNGYQIGSSIAREDFVLPFGFHPRQMVWSILRYYVFLSWWYTVPLLLGIAFWIYRFVKHTLGFSEKVYGLIWVWVTIALLFFYGNYPVQDTLEPRLVTMGTSYSRYWLPSFVMALPMVAWGLESVRFFSEIAWRRRVCIGVVGLTFFLLSVRLVFMSHDGLFNAHSSIRRGTTIAVEIDRMVESAAVIVVDQFDKFIFPKHPVIVPLREVGNQETIQEFSKYIPLYYYGLTLTPEEKGMLEEKIGIQFGEIKKFDWETLYRLVPR